MDSYVLVGPQGSAINVGSYVRADPGPDFGAKDLLKSEYAETPFIEGGYLAGESMGVRSMTFPVRLASSGAFVGGLPGIEAFLRSCARPGAYVDLMPNGVATAEAVRFDVVGGRYEEDYSIRQNEVGRREGTLKLEVEPYGYWPTQITLASVASVGLPGRVAVPGASVLGDAPALARIAIQPTAPTSYPLGTWAPDMLAWSLAAKPSAVPFWPAASLASAIPGALGGDAFAPASQALSLYPSPTQGGWRNVANLTIPSALEPDYRGRFRAFAWAKLTPSQPIPYQLSLDAVPAVNPQAALASAQSVATLAPNVRGASIAAASPAYHLLDLGELVLPPVASGLRQDQLVRLWANPAGTTIGIATPVIALGGLYLLPLDGDVGYLPRGLGVPTFATPSPGRFVTDKITRRTYIGVPGSDLSSAVALANAPHYRGAQPQITASTTALDILSGARRTDLAAQYRDEVLSEGAAQLYYYPLSDAVPTYVAPFQSAYGPTGIFSGTPSAAQRGALLNPSAPGVFFTAAGAVASGVCIGASSFSAELWFMRASAIATEQTLLSHGTAIATAWNHLRIGMASPNRLAVRFGASDVGMFSVPSWPNPDATYHHLVLTFDYTTLTRKLYLDASVVASQVAGTYYAGPSSTLRIGQASGQWYFPGLMDEVALYPGLVLSPTRVAAHYLAGVSPTGGATAPLVRASEAFAAVSVTYRPRFRFLKTF